ncbi:DNA binding domain-containing protein, excisionase family [Tessaracoccus bendigoensis DSM 12906]|uniref:DNA binding domain-containing protein, excisionase family n=1 Tax=Tessaracoccus bendigoensis DSM 12906 TaxID=1123357 RepID=A0A1M6LVL6_9ACTN|nr:helix-turn-helix domain-containing protein [Tessaracoccus bendigoensis]SHJ75231.1 DNA binding domain-containing protein, excisionase family [Tessaracoccus bendigoensis DSM 12906]
MKLDTSRGRVMANDREVELAAQVLAELSCPDGSLAVSRNHEVSEVPEEIGRLLQHVLDVLARGGTVTVGSMPAVLTTTTAAGILGISRPTLMKLIDKGEIPSHKVGSHTRLKAVDVYSALRARRERERAAFAELMELDYDS